jgi:signal transduction histidine kinase
MGVATETLATHAVPGRRGVREAWVTVVAGAAAVALSLAAPPLHGLPMHVGPQIVHVAVAAAYIGAGTVALIRRPGVAIGPLMIAVGFLWFIPDLGWIRAALPFTISITYPALYQPVLAHLALAFPSGKLPGRFERLAIAALYVWTLLNNVVVEMFDDPQANGCVRCPRNLLLVDSDTSLQHTVSNIATSISVVLVATTAALIVRHWWRATRAAQYIMAPVLWVVAPAAGYIAVSQVAELTTFPDSAQRFVRDWLPLGLAILPVGFLVGLLRTRLAYAHVGALAAELAGPVAPGRVRDVLARMLHDPDLELLYWAPSSRQYVDIDGNPRAPDDAVADRTVTYVRGETGPLAALIVDAAGTTEPGLLRAAESMTRLALENERLHAEVRSQLVTLRQTTARLVDAGQEGRRRLERDLHDGAQQRLLALAMTLGQARGRLDGDTDPQVRAYLDQASNDLQQAITELRELARGIHPVLLTTEGLASALQALAERAPLPVHVTASRQRYEPAVEAAAYFVVSEALANASRHSNAHRVIIDVHDSDGVLTVSVSDDGIGGASAAGTRSGSGLQGMRDRVVAAGGEFNLASTSAAGTTITATLQCG